MTPLRQEEHKAMRPTIVNAELRAFAYSPRESPRLGRADGGDGDSFGAAGGDFGPSSRARLVVPGGRRPSARNRRRTVSTAEKRIATKSFMKTRRRQGFLLLPSKELLHFPQILRIERGRRGAEKLFEVRPRRGGLAFARERGAEVVERIEVPWVQLHGARPGVNRGLAVSRPEGNHATASLPGRRPRIGRDRLLKTL